MNVVSCFKYFCAFKYINIKENVYEQLFGEIETIVASALNKLQGRIIHVCFYFSHVTLIMVSKSEI